MQMQLPRPAQALYRVIGNPSVRLGAVAALALVAVWGMQASTASQDADISSMLEVGGYPFPAQMAGPLVMLTQLEVNTLFLGQSLQVHLH